jgi:hypothetical protein
VPSGTPEGTGTTARGGSGVTSSSNYIADVAAARVIQSAAAKATTSAAKAAAEEAATKKTASKATTQNQSQLDKAERSGAYSNAYVPPPAGKPAASAPGSTLLPSGARGAYDRFYQANLKLDPYNPGSSLSVLGSLAGFCDSHLLNRDYRPTRDPGASRSASSSTTPPARSSSACAKNSARRGRSATCSKTFTKIPTSTAISPTPPASSGALLPNREAELGLVTREWSPRSGLYRDGTPLPAAPPPQHQPRAAVSRPPVPSFLVFPGREAGSGDHSATGTARLVRGTRTAPSL